MAPSRSISRVSTGASCSTSAFAISSTAVISSALTGFGCEKSKRSRSGATSEPFCATCVPSVCRSASCSRCVAEWLARMAVRLRGIDRELHRVARARAVRPPSCRYGRRARPPCARYRSRGSARRPPKRSCRCRRPGRRTRRRTASGSRTSAPRLAGAERLASRRRPSPARARSPPLPPCRSRGIPSPRAGRGASARRFPSRRRRSRTSWRAPPPAAAPWRR